MEKIDISGLKKNRSINFKIGLIAALSLTIMAFNFTTPHSEKEERKIAGETVVTEEMTIERTAQKKTPPLPTLELSDQFEAVEDITLPDIEEPKPISIDIDEGPEIIFDDGPYIDDSEIEPDVDEAPLDILIEEPPRDFAEYMPSFGTCDVVGLSKEEYKQCSDMALLQYFAKHIKYPTVARENRIEGRVILRFVIDENGDVKGAKIMRGVPGGCSEEAMRVLSSMPKWKAGRHGGRNVKVNFTLPVMFKLK